MTNNFTNYSFLKLQRNTKKSCSKKTYLVLLIAIFALLSANSFAQSKTINGTVTDEANGDPLPGVSIIVKGESTGAVTDFDGNYTLNVKSSNVTLVFSYIGYATQTIAVNNRSTINVKLKEDINVLDEVQIVSIGYGTVKRENLTGSVASISANTLAKLPVTNGFRSFIRKTSWCKGNVLRWCSWIRHCN